MLDDLKARKAKLERTLAVLQQQLYKTQGALEIINDQIDSIPKDVPAPMELVQPPIQA